MSDLSELSIEQIQNILLIELYANENKKLNQYVLFNKFIERFDSKNKYISPLTKNKFLLVLKNLKNRFDDIEIIIENNIIYATCKKESDISINSDNIQTDLENELIDSLLDNIDINNYIIENKIYDELEYEDSNGNTINHNLVCGNDYHNLKKLIEENRFNYLKKNKFNKTPIDFIKNQEISNIFIKKLYLEINELNNRIIKLEKDDILKKVNELTFFQFIKIKLFNLNNFLLFKIFTCLLISIIFIMMLLIYPLKI